jgi:hypothetical protein
MRNAVVALWRPLWIGQLKPPRIASPRQVTARARPKFGRKTVRDGRPEKGSCREVKRGETCEPIVPSDLCRGLCHNPRIPARIGRCRVLSLGYT